jgi:hypothetical protein
MPCACACAWCARRRCNASRCDAMRGIERGGRRREEGGGACVDRKGSAMRVREEKIMETTSIAKNQREGHRRSSFVAISRCRDSSFPRHVPRERERTHRRTGRRTRRRLWRGCVASSLVLGIMRRRTRYGGVLLHLSLVSSAAMIICCFWELHYD